MAWIVTFIAVCAGFAAWTVISDHAYQRKRQLRKIQRRLAEKGESDPAE